jgi:hypothetical protein
MTSSTTTPDFSPGEIRSTPVVSPTHTSIPDTFPPSKWRPNISLNPINNTSANMSDSSSSSTSHCSEPASPAATEIDFSIIHIDQSPEERMETLRAAGIKVRDFAYEATAFQQSPEPGYSCIVRGGADTAEATPMHTMFALAWANHSFLEKDGRHHNASFVECVDSCE